MTCYEAAALLHALVDGELDAAHVREVETHVATCARCAAQLATLRGLRRAFADAPLQFRAPEELRQRINTALPAPASPRTSRRTLLKGFTLGAGLSAAIAASALLVIMRTDQSQRLASELVSAHLRSLQGEHLTDVQTSDRHMVKPWFNGRIDVAPPVVDLTVQGFTLIGGRLDVIDGKPAAAIVYRRRNHVINLFIAPELGLDRGESSTDHMLGFNIRHWSAAGLSFAAVSDINGEELQEFAERFQAGAHAAD